MKLPLPLDSRYDWLALLGTATSLVLIFYFYDQLPEKVPTHFNGLGEPDNWSGKAMLWSLPALSVFMYVFLGGIGKYANFNSKFSSSRPKPGQEAVVRSLNLAMMGSLRALIILMFTYLCWESIQIGLGHTSKLGSWVLPVFIVLIFVYCFYYIYHILKRSDQN